MTVTVSTLAERALRRLNVAVVPLDDRPTLTEMIPVATIAIIMDRRTAIRAGSDTIPALCRRRNYRR